MENQTHCTCDRIQMWTYIAEGERPEHWTCVPSNPFNWMFAFWYIRCFPCGLLLCQAIENQLFLLGFSWQKYWRAQRDMVHQKTKHFSPFHCPKVPLARSWNRGAFGIVSELIETSLIQINFQAYASQRTSNIYFISATIKKAFC